jgi:hypothetical protein
LPDPGLPADVVERGELLQVKRPFLDLGGVAFQTMLI